MSTFFFFFFFNNCTKGTRKQRKKTQGIFSMSLLGLVSTLLVILLNILLYLPTAGYEKDGDFLGYCLERPTRIRPTPIQPYTTN